MAHHVAHRDADRDADRAVGQRQHVVPVTAGLVPVGADQVPGRDLQPRDLGHRGQQAALQGRRSGVFDLVEPGVVDRQSGPAGQIGGQVQVTRAVAATVRVLGEQGQRAQYPAAGPHRDHHRRPQPQPVVGVPGRRVTGMPVRPALGQLGEQHRLVPRQHVTRVAAGTDPVVAHQAELAQPALVGRVPGRDRDPLGGTGAGAVQQVDCAQVGQLWHDDPGKPRARVGDVESLGHPGRGLGEQP